MQQQVPRWLEGRYLSGAPSALASADVSPRDKEKLEDGPHQSTTDRRRRSCGGRSHDGGCAIGSRPEGRANPTLRGAGRSESLRSRLDDSYITRNHSYLVYDTLFGTDENFQIKPQMVDRVTVSPDGMKYTFTLREGLRWHDGQQVQSEDCVESLKRWGRTNRFGQLLMARTGKIAPVD